MRLCCYIAVPHTDPHTHTHTHTVIHTWLHSTFATQQFAIVALAAIWLWHLPASSRSRASNEFSSCATWNCNNLQEAPKVDRSARGREREKARERERELQQIYLPLHVRLSINLWGQSSAVYLTHTQTQTSALSLYRTLGLVIITKLRAYLSIEFMPIL